MTVNRFMLAAEASQALNYMKDLVRIRVGARMLPTVHEQLDFAGRRARIAGRNLGFSIGDRVAPKTPAAKRTAREIHIDRTIINADNSNSGS